MIAARLHEFGGVPVVEEVADPVVADGESLVAVEAAAVAHIDVTVAGGEFAFRPELPHVPGTDGAGRIVRSSELAEGTPVRVRGGEVGLTRDGTWAELVCVPDESLDAVPEGLDMALVATFFSPCVTGWIAIHEVGRVAAGERVAVIGAAGAVGRVATQLALRAGAMVVGVEPDGERAADIASGAEARRSLDGVEVDVLVDTAGGEGLQSRLESVRPSGRAVLIGYAAGTTATLDLPAFLASDVALLPVNLIRWNDRMRERAVELLELVCSGELECAVSRYALDDAAKALADVAAGRARGRAVLIPSRKERT